MDEKRRGNKPAIQPVCGTKSPALASVEHCWYDATAMARAHGAAAANRWAVGGGAWAWAEERAGRP
jgi:hypothetical protein